MAAGYLVFACPRCGMVRYARQGQRTAECFRCGFKVKLESPETRILLRTEKVAEAIEAVKNYKMKLHNCKHQA